MIKISIVIPVYNDHESLIKLIKSIDASKVDEYVINIIIVDDFSNKLIAPIFDNRKYKRISTITVIRLKHNCGHQIAIREGLLESLQANADYTVVMDGDGEDKPELIPELINESISSQQIVVASRGERYDSLIFKLFYKIYTMLFKIMTTSIINFGNFSVIPYKQLDVVCSMSTIGIHFPATLLKSKLEIRYIKINRGKRYVGESKMNLTSLIFHGLKSFGVFNDIVIPRLLIFSSVIISFIILSIAAILSLKLLGMATPGWASNLASSLLILSFQVFTIAFISLISLPSSKAIEKNLVQLKSTKNYTDP